MKQTEERRQTLTVLLFHICSKLMTSLEIGQKQTLGIRACFCYGLLLVTKEHQTVNSAKKQKSFSFDNMNKNDDSLC